MWKYYYTPTDLAAALALLAHYQTDARVAAGCTDLLLEIERMLRAPRALVDITRIAGLDSIRLQGSVIHLGPLVTHNQVVASPLLAEHAYPLVCACRAVGAPQIRNRGTLAGNLVTASPANDAIAPLWALDATLTLISVRGQRALKLEQFYKGVRRTDLAPDEIVVDIAFPAMPPTQRGAFLKLGLRQTQAISVVNAAVVLDFEGQVVRAARITLGAVAPTIIRATAAENYLLGRALDPAGIEAAAELAAGAARPIDDIRSPADYRVHIVRALTARLLRQLAQVDWRSDGPPTDPSHRPALLWGRGDGRFPAGQGPGTLHSIGDADSGDADSDQPILTRVNGQSYSIHGANDKTLLHMLREQLGLTGVKEGCGEGECGACTVYLDGIAVLACLTPAARAHGAEITTVEGLATGGQLHPVQAAFVTQHAIQCGYCTPGFVMAAAKLLEELPHPTRQQIEQAISGNVCRCTGYANIVRAIDAAAASAPATMATPPTAIGGSATRLDSADKTTGRTRYAEDIGMPGLLHAVVLRCPHHHARLLALDTRTAAAMPGLVKIITAEHIPGLNGLDGYSRNEPVLTPIGDTARQKGAPVALVVAESRRQAQAAADAIQADYEVLPYTFDADQALADDAVRIYPQGNVLSTFEVAHGDLEATLAASDVVLETRYNTPFQEHAALERETTLGYLDEQGRVTVVGGTHEPHWQQGYIAQTLGVDPARVRVIFPPTGGSFGGRQDPWPLVAAGLMAHLLRRPVRLAYSRREVFDATPKRHPYQMHFTLGASRSGQLSGIRVRIHINTGGYDSAGYWIPNYAITASGGAYCWQAVDARAQTIYTNGPKCGQFRGYGTPQSTFGLECTLDELAARLALDPLEFRLNNCLQPGGISFLGYPLAETPNYAEVLQALRPRYAAFQQEAAEFNAQRPTREADRLRMSVGIAGMWYRFGKSGSLRIEAHAELARDGHVVISCSAPDYGQGINTVMLQLAAETLGVPREQIELVNADTALTPDSGIQGASRATYFTGSAVCAAARNLKDALLATASEVLDCDPAGLVISRAGVLSGQDPSRGLSLERLAQEFEALGKSRKVIGLFDLSPHFPAETRPEYIPCFVSGAQAAQVVVDMETGQVEVRRIAAAHDVGRAINRPDAIGQIQGAIVMGLGTTLCEDYVPGRSSGLSDYIVPMVSAVPDIEVFLVEIPSRYGPFGAKGLGEAAILPTAPAIVNAVSRAIGARLRALPLSPPRVLKAIQSQVKAPARD